MCETSSDCNDRGFCINNQCLCDVAWFDDNCENNLKRTLPNAFITYRVIFLIIFSLIGLVSFIKLYLKIRKEKNLLIESTFIFMLKSMRSPYILTMLSILGIFLTRIHWLAIDPFGYDDIFHRSLERVLFETTYSLLFVIYAIVLWVWGSIYEEIGLKRSQNGKRNLRWFKSKLMVFIVLVIAVQLTTSILKGYYIDRIRTATLIIYIALFAILVIVILEYCIYGWLLYKCISDQEKKIDAQFKIVKEKVKASAGHVESALGSLYDLPKKGDSEKSKGNILQDILEEDPDTPRSDENQNLNRLDSDFSGSPQKGRPSRSSQQPQQSVKIMGFEQLAKHDVNSLDNLESKGVGSVSNLDGPGTGHFGKSLSSPISKKQTLNHKSTIDMAFEVKVRKIVERHEAYLTPVEILEDFSHDNIAAEASVIFDDNDDVVWDFEDLNELKIKEEVQKVKKAEIERNKQNIIQSRQRTIIRTASTSVTKNRLADLYLQKLMDDPEYLDNHQKMTVKDKKVIKKIFSLTVIAICLEIVFVVITILIFGTPVLQSPAGMIISMWITGFIEVFAITAIILLFSLVDSQENDNLRIIMRLGQNKNRINRLYGFTLPPYLRKEESKKKLEKRINQTTTGYLHSLESIPG